MGLRNRVNREKKNPFLVSESLIPIEGYVLRTHSSKLWPETVVIDPKLTSLHVVSLSELSETLVVDYLNILGFRCQHKLSDIALRNLLICDGRMYSIDEESVNSDFDLLVELKKTNYTITKKLFADNSEKMNSSLKLYLEKFLHQ